MEGWLTSKLRKNFLCARSEDKQPEQETEQHMKTHASTFSGATASVGTASITATTLCESTDAAADIIAEDAFVAGVRHDCFDS